MIRKPKNRHELDAADLKARVVISEVVGRIVALRRSGASWTGRCPFHDDHRPSLTVNDDVGLWYCHGCAEGGDVISFVMRRAGCRFVEALEWLADLDGRALPDARREKGTIGHRRRRTVFAQAAKDIWRGSVPVHGTIAELYLASRGIVGPVPGTLRFARAPAWIDGDTGQRRNFRPALIAACQDVDGHIIGIQRTFLAPGGRKSSMRSPRLSLGQIRGGALRFGPESADVMLVEGVEDGLSLQRMFVGATVWATLGAGNLPHVELPNGVKRVILAGDNDGPGRAAVDAGIIAYEAKGREVAAIFPRAEMRDFNEEWMELHA